MTLQDYNLRTKKFEDPELSVVNLLQIKKERLKRFQLFIWSDKFLIALKKPVAKPFPRKKMLSPNSKTKFFYKNKRTMTYKRCALLLTSLALAIRCFTRCQEQHQKPKRCFWVRKILSEEKKERCECEDLFCELREDDRR